jgi:inner membrane protein
VGPRTADCDIGPLHDWDATQFNSAATRLQAQPTRPAFPSADLPRNLAEARHRALLGSYPHAMEPVTHILTGACLSRAGFNRKAAYSTLAMSFAAEAPDLDFLTRLGGSVTGFQQHRGITHTFVAAPVIALVTVGMVWLIHRWRRKPPAVAPRWGLLWLFSLIAVLVHLLLDYTNNYGLRPFFPFSDHWYACSATTVFDPFILLALVAALLIPWIIGLAKREPGARRIRMRARAWPIAALIFVALFCSLRIAEHAHAIELARNSKPMNKPITLIDAEPSMVNPFAWQVIADMHDIYSTVEVHTLHDNVLTDSASTIHKPEVTPSVAAAKQSLLGRLYLDWSEFPMVTDIGNAPAPGLAPPQSGWHTVTFQDLRYPLPAWVYIGPDNTVEAMLVGSAFTLGTYTGH